jgi:polar amino acid transport system permease protein
VLDLSLLAFSPQGWGDNLLRGLLRTLEVAVVAYSLGLAIGLLGAFGKVHGGTWLRRALDLYTMLFRALPELVLILLLFYAGPDLLNRFLESLGYARVEVSGFAAGVIALGIVQSAYSMEVIRGAILAVPAGQIEAGAAFGMSFWQSQRRIVIPGMIPSATPGLANLWLIVTKDTALLAVISYNELAKETQQAAESTQYHLQFFLAAALIYLALSLVSTVIIRRIEERFRRGQPALESER